MARKALRRNGYGVSDPDPDLKALGQAVRQLRKAAAISQPELGHRAELSANYISDLERGTRNVSAKALFKLARALDVSPAAFFADAPDTRRAD